MPTTRTTASFGYWIRRQRQALDLTQAALARLIGCATVTISKLERDERHASRQMAELLAEHLAVPAGQRAHFVAAALGEYAVDGMPLASQPVTPPGTAYAPHSQFSFAVLHAPIRSNLPAPTTPLIGRDEELAQLAGLLADPQCRLVTILGPGGMGKSRLALAAGHAAVDHFAGSVCLVELVALRSADEIARAIGNSLDYPFQNDPRPPRRQILGYLRRRHLLLILDNFEHLLDETEFLVELLESAPGVRLLVTSRERLRLQAETIFQLEGLPYPLQGDERLGEADGYAAIELFVQSAQRLHREYIPDKDDWSSIARICHLVDGMPLGILLAASWSDVLAPQEIAEEIGRGLDLLQAQLSDLEPRHRNITSVFEQSWRRLTSEEQRVLAGLSIFAGGFDRDATQAVAGASLAILTRLVGKSLLWRVGEGRYDLHELVRQFARQKLTDGGREEIVRALHSRWFLALVSRQEPRLKGAQEIEAIALMEQERENVRVAWDWATQHGEIDLLQQAIEALGIFHNRPGQRQEGEALMRSTGEILGEAASPGAWLLHAWLSAWRGLFLHWAGQGNSAQQHLTQLLERLENLSLSGVDLRPVQAFAYQHRGGGLMTDRRWGEMEMGLRQALALYDELGEVWWKTRCLIDLGFMQIFKGEVLKAHTNTEMARNLACANGDRSGEIQALRYMSLAIEQMGRPEEAEALARQALALARNDGQRQDLRHLLAFVLLAVGKFEESAPFSQSAIDWMNSMGFDPVNLPFDYNNLARAYLHLGRYDEAHTLAQESLRRWTEAHGWEHPYILRTVARAVHALGDATVARHLLHRSIKEQQEVKNKNLFALSCTFTECVLPALSLNDLAEARQMLAEGLRLVQRGEAFTCTCLALPAAALLLAQEERLQEAAYIYAAIQRYPRLTNSRWYATVALDRLEQSLAPLSPDARAAAEERGRAEELPEITAALLALLA